MGFSYTPADWPLHTSPLLPMPSRFNRRKPFPSHSSNHTIWFQLIVSETILPIRFLSCERHQELNGDVVEKAGGGNKNGCCGEEPIPLGKWGVD